ncbi:1,4-dihydroxy-2-naphthoate polyprenyltransferase [Demequina muriae]|uniref:1,4-dihydroxy-2-naphthoate octaprenyltransferase n=1 Tax=Demequina muriae TaxID=3051664 RepID=A0ABT8GH44_9MICO|nr:1,4-dihydroxy-2-naphthoate polyprenyltransferase [Demequina sp. EGI L300058]MDN4480750.1 1,4-dihydroxy-2-naphthoate polyprenyltransferase [Demequina sp. EGI L300058]
MTTAADWVAGARPRTLWTAVSPVAVGSASAGAMGMFAIDTALLALVVALGLQVGSNYANDYSDGIRGTDVDRIGPDRLVATGKATPTAVKGAAFVSFAVAALAGIFVVFLAGALWLLLLGLFAIIAAWTYTGTDRPYGYAGWGEVAVFAFFGPVAVLGTMYVQAGDITWWAIAASVGVGLYAVALLMVNNIRDLDTDAAAGKRTLAVKIGSHRARQVFAAVVLLPVLCAVVVAFVHPWALLATVVALPSLYFAIAMRIDGAVREQVGMPSGGLKVIFAGLSAVGLVYGLALALGIAL